MNSRWQYEPVIQKIMQQCVYTRGKKKINLWFYTQWKRLPQMKVKGVKVKGSFSNIKLTASSCVKTANGQVVHSVEHTHYSVQGLQFRPLVPTYRREASQVAVEHMLHYVQGSRFGPPPSYGSIMHNTKGKFMSSFLLLCPSSPHLANTLQGTEK